VYNILLLSAFNFFEHNLHQLITAAFAVVYTFQHLPKVNWFNPCT